MTFDEDALAELAASITRARRPPARSWFARPTISSAISWSPASAAGALARAAGLKEIPALIEQLDDETALEIGIIENLQREDLSPLEEAMIYDRMTHEHGYSVRRLAQKLGKDKGYIENRLRLAGAPTEIKQLVSLRKDTVSHAYELLKVEDPKKRRRLAEQVASRRAVAGQAPRKDRGPAARGARRADDVEQLGARRRRRAAAHVAAIDRPAPAEDDALIDAKASLTDALDRARRRARAAAGPWRRSATPTARTWPST